MEKQKGFTLIELLVSISIFSVIGLGSYQVLQSAIDSRARVHESATSVLSLTRFLSILQKDFMQLTSRKIRDNYGDVSPSYVFDEDGYVVEFTRRGWSNPSGKKRSNLQRVAYSINYKEKTLTRHFWEVLDRAEDSEPVDEIVMRGVEEFLITPISDSTGSEELSPENSSGEFLLPLGLEVTLVLESSGQIDKVIQLVENPPEKILNRKEKGKEAESDIEI